MKELTVLTPTYNRAKRLTVNLYLLRSSISALGKNLIQLPLRLLQIIILRVLSRQVNGFLEKKL